MASQEWTFFSDPSPIVLNATVEGLDDIVQRLDAGLLTIAAFSQVVKQHAYMAQAQAVVNVSGVQVTWSGGFFTVNRGVSGKLAQSITVLQPNALSAIVKANAKYANAIEGGVDHPIDMKPYLLGKTIPIRTRGMGDAHLAQTSVQGPALWAMRVEGPVRGGVKRMVKKNSKGKVSKVEFIAFRRVTAVSKGWILPVRPARPFMLAAAEKIEPLFGAAVAEVYRKHVEGEL